MVFKEDNRPKSASMKGKPWLALINAFLPTSNNRKYLYQLDAFNVFFEDWVSKTQYKIKYFGKIPVPQNLKILTLVICELEGEKTPDRNCLRPPCNYPASNNLKVKCQFHFIYK